MSSNLARWDFNAEKPGAFPQEKRDTSYPRASLGSCPWQLLLTQLQLGRSGALLVFCFPTRLSKPHTSVHRAEFVFLSKTSLPLPLKGEGRGITFLGLVGFALLVQNWGTLAQQGRPGALVVSFPYLASRTAHRATQGRVWVSPSFLSSLSRWQPSQLALQVVVDGFLNGKDRVKQRPVSRSSVQCPHRCRQGFDEILVL